MAQQCVKCGVEITRDNAAAFSLLTGNITCIDCFKEGLQEIKELFESKTGGNRWAPYQRYTRRELNC